MSKLLEAVEAIDALLPELMRGNGEATIRQHLATIRAEAERIRALEAELEQAKHAADTARGNASRLADEKRALEAEKKAMLDGCLRFIDSTLCETHRGRVLMQSPGEFIAEHRGKCALCLQAENAELKRKRDAHSCYPRDAIDAG